MVEWQRISVWEDEKVLDDSSDGCTTLWMCLMSSGSLKMMKWSILFYVYFTSIYENKWRKGLKSKRGKVTNIIDSQKGPEKEKKKNKKINKHNAMIQENLPKIEKKKNGTTC